VVCRFFNTSIAFIVPFHLPRIKVPAAVTRVSSWASCGTTLVTLVETEERNVTDQRDSNHDTDDKAVNRHEDVV
jgi:hypothetical protein